MALKIYEVTFEVRGKTTLYVKAKNESEAADLADEEFTNGIGEIRDEVLTNLIEVRITESEKVRADLEKRERLNEDLRRLNEIHKGEKSNG